MKLKTASKIQLWVNIILFVITLPISTILLVLRILEKPFDWLIGQITNALFWIGNKLMLLSDEAKNGEIKNDYCLRNYTARLAYKVLEEEKKRNNDG